MAERVKLKEICRLINGRAYKQDELLDSGKYPVLRVGNFFSDKDFYYSDLELEDDKYCDNGDLLFAWSASFGPMVWNGGKVIYHYHIWKMELTERVERDYLYFYLFHLSERIKSEGHGGIMIHTTKAEMEEREFLLPELQEQRNIVKVLSKISTVIAARKDELQKLDELVKARFVEMFGNTHENIQLSEVADITGGLTKNSKRNQFSLKMPYLRVANVFFDKIDVTEILEIGLTPDEVSKTLLQNGDLLFVEGNGSPEQIGRVAVWRDEIENCVHQNHLIKARFDFQKMLPDYAMNYFMTQAGREQIKAKAVSTSGLYTLSVSKIAALNVPVAPLELQIEFVKFKQQVDKSKVAVQKALDEAQLLFDSMMQKYFG